MGMQQALPGGRTRTLPLAKGLAELDCQCSRLDGLDALPAALGVVGAADDVAQPCGLVLVGIGVDTSRGRAAGLRFGRKALIEEARIFRSSIVVGISGL
jgi:hypothetical protein